MLADVRFGSEADIPPLWDHVRFTPQERTNSEAVGLSARCQSRHFALRKTASLHHVRRAATRHEANIPLLDHLIRPRQQRRGHSTHIPWHSRAGGGAAHGIKSGSQSACVFNPACRLHYNARPGPPSPPTPHHGFPGNWKRLRQWSGKSISRQPATTVQIFSACLLRDL